MTMWEVRNDASPIVILSSAPIFVILRGAPPFVTLRSAPLLSF